MEENENIKRKKRNFIIIGVAIAVLLVSFKGYADFRMAKLK